LGFNEDISALIIWVLEIVRITVHLVQALVQHSKLKLMTCLITYLPIEPINLHVWVRFVCDTNQWNPLCSLHEPMKTHILTTYLYVWLIVRFNWFVLWTRFCFVCCLLIMQKKTKKKKN